MTAISGKTIIISITLIFIFFIFLWIGTISFFNNNPGIYRYTIDIKNLDQYQTAFLTDIIVPLPVREGQQVFTDNELQYQTFGSWKSMLVVTPYGKMLAFQNIGQNLTDIHAEFTRKYPNGERIQNITADSLSPVLTPIYSPNTNWIYGSRSIRNYSTIIFIPDSVTPLNRNAEEISLSIELIASGGMQHSVTDTTYRISISERIPPNVRNMTPVTAQIGLLDVKDLNSDYRWIPVPLN